MYGSRLGQVRLGQVRWMGAGVWGLAPSQMMKGQTLRGWEKGSGGETPSQGMRARLLGWPGQVGIFFKRKRFFERTLFEQKILYIYKAYFSFEFLSKIGVFSKERLFEGTYKNSAFRTNEIRKKILNFEQTLFDRTTSSRNLSTVEKKSFFLYNGLAF